MKKAITIIVTSLMIVLGSVALSTSPASATVGSCYDINTGAIGWQMSSFSVNDPMWYPVTFNHGPVAGHVEVLYYTIANTYLGTMLFAWSNYFDMIGAHYLGGTGQILMMIPIGYVHGSSFGCNWEDQQ